MRRQLRKIAGLTSAINVVENVIVLDRAYRKNRENTTNKTSILSKTFG